MKLFNNSLNDKSFGGNDKFELDLSSYAAKAELKYATEVDTSKLAAKSDLAETAKKANIK